MFTSAVTCIVEFRAPVGSALILDGGAIWTGGDDPAAPSPAKGALNTTGVQSSAPLISVGSSAHFILGENVYLQNNDRTLAADLNGGAIVSQGEFTLAGGSVIHNRTSGSGGGIFFAGPAAASSLIAGGSIRENHSELSGGGVMFDSLGGVKVTMGGGEISGNRASGIDAAISTITGYGGGVFVPSHSTNPVNEFRMQGGVIRNNRSDHASGKGKGVVIDHKINPAPLFEISGSARITGGDDVLLGVNASPLYWCYITVAGTLTAPSPVAVISVTGLYTIPVGSPLQVLEGSFDASKFAAFAPYSLHSDGKLYP
jgi:hypothetical protein